jgi:Flp pilus assembly protein TadG
MPTRTLPKRHLSAWRRDRAGVAALEFGLILPVLVLLAAGLADLGVYLRTRSALAGGVAAAGQYAFLLGPTVSASTLSGIVSASSGLGGLTVQVSGPACACPSGTPPALAAATCGSLCADGRAAGTYITISARFPYTPALPGFSLPGSDSLSETTIVRLK